jgi:hypothetical protein
MSPASFRTDVRLRSEQTHGELSLIENTVAAGWEGPPLHQHDFDETFYVLDGELTFQLGSGSSPAAARNARVTRGPRARRLGARGLRQEPARAADGREYSPSNTSAYLS